MGPTDADQVSKHMSMFGRLVPPVKQSHGCEMVDLQSPSKSATMFVIADSTNDALVPISLQRFLSLSMPISSVVFLETADVVLAPTGRRAVFGIERLPAPERLLTAWARNFHLPLARLVRALVRTELTITHGRIIPELLATGHTFSGLHRFTIRYPVAGQPVADRSFGDTAFRCDRLLIAPLLDVLVV